MVENKRLKLGERNWTITIVGTPMVFNFMQVNRRVSMGKLTFRIN
jgi:hypothetical protein